MNKSDLVKNVKADLAGAKKNENPLWKIAYSEIVRILTTIPDQKGVIQGLHWKIGNCGGMEIEPAFTGALDRVKAMTEEEWNS